MMSSQMKSSKQKYRHPRHDLSRMGFQLDRFMAFSDGVFAIVITLMIFEMKAPEVSDLAPVLNDNHLFEKLQDIAWKFFGLIISFVIVGYYWSVHHRIFGYAIRYSTRLLWINLAFLFSVGLLPFSSALLGEYASYGNMHLPYGIYTLNIVMTGLINCWMWVYMSNPKLELLTRKIPPSRIRLGVLRSLVIPFVFLVSFAVSLFSQILSRVLLLLIPLIHTWGMRQFEERADRDDDLKALHSPIPEEDDTPVSSV